MARRADVPGVLPGGTWSSPTAVNERDVVVGWTRFPGRDTAERALVWARGTLTRLGDEHRTVVVTDQSARGHVLVDEYDEGVRARLHVPPRKGS